MENNTKTMREIKFRYVYRNVDTDEITMIEKDITQIEKEEEPYIDDGVLISRDQFTGFTDRNGEEIYEGDILEFITKRKYGFLYDGVKVRIKVEFGKFNPMNDTLYDFIGFHTNDSSIQYYLKYGCEIDGNIHDNPELLK